MPVPPVSLVLPGEGGGALPLPGLPPSAQALLARANRVLRWPRYRGWLAALLAQPSWRGWPQAWGGLLLVSLVPALIQGPQNRVPRRQRWPYLLVSRALGAAAVVFPKDPHWQQQKTLGLQPLLLVLLPLLWQCQIQWGPRWQQMMPVQIADAVWHQIHADNGRSAPSPRKCEVDPEPP